MIWTVMKKSQRANYTVMEIQNIRAINYNPNKRRDLSDCEEITCKSCSYRNPKCPRHQL